MGESWMEANYPTATEPGDDAARYQPPTPARPDPDPEWTDAPEAGAAEPEAPQERPEAKPAPGKPTTLREALQDMLKPFRGLPVAMIEVGEAAEKATRSLKLYLQVTDAESGDTITELEMTGPSTVINDAGSAALSAIHYSTTED